MVVVVCVSVETERKKQPHGRGNMSCIYVDRHTCRSTLPEESSYTITSAVTCRTSALRNGVLLSSRQSSNFKRFRCKAVRAGRVRYAFATLLAQRAKPG